MYVFEDGKSGFRGCECGLRAFSGDNLPGAVGSLKISKHSAF